MGLVLITPATTPVLTLDEAKLQIRWDDQNGDVEDDAIAAMVAGATDQAEQFLRRPLLTAAYRYTQDAFPGRFHADALSWAGILGTGQGVHSDSFIRLPIGGVSSVTEVGYVDVDGNPQVMDPSAYQVSTTEPTTRIAPAYQTTWPSARRVLDAVHVNFTAGFGASSDTIPSSIVSAVKLILGHLYANRETIVIGQTAVDMPNGAEHLLWPYRVFPLHS